MREDVTARACENFATPFYLLDLEEFREQIRNLQAVLGEQIRLCYAVKANPFLIRTAAGEGLKLEVCSPGELAICERLGISMEQVVLSGVYKEESGILELIERRMGKASIRWNPALNLRCLSGEPGIDIRIAGRTGSCA